jgi:hypothetical protein
MGQRLGDLGVGDGAVRFQGESQNTYAGGAALKNMRGYRPAG